MLLLISYVIVHYTLLKFPFDFDSYSVLCATRREIGKHVKCLLRRFQTLFKSVRSLNALFSITEFILWRFYDLI